MTRMAAVMMELFMVTVLEVLPIMALENAAPQPH